MSALIHRIATAVPPYAYHQEYAADCMKRWVKDRVLQRMVHHVYRQSGIERRFSVLPDFQPEATSGIFGEQPDGTLVEPTTGQRNDLYRLAYPALVEDAVRRAFAQTPWIRPGDVTHLVTVSCTGFCNPGPDLHIAATFGLRADVERYHIGFMGCYAAFPALRMADQFCRANPDAVVLVVGVELCSLHLQIKPSSDLLLANALFADGAAAVLVSARPLPDGACGARLEAFATRLVPDSARDMAWTIGDRGFDMVLSSYVPKILALHAKQLVADLLAGCREGGSGITEWAVHPGGKAILQAFEQQMGWSGETGALAHAHRILRRYGNMSSVTILFVLEAVLADPAFAEATQVGALAFGPGLTVEFAHLTLCGTRPVALPTEPCATHQSASHA